MRRRRWRRTRRGRYRTRALVCRSRLGSLSFDQIIRRTRPPEANDDWTYSIWPFTLNTSPLSGMTAMTRSESRNLSGRYLNRLIRYVCPRLEAQTGRRQRWCGPSPGVGERLSLCPVQTDEALNGLDAALNRPFFSLGPGPGANSGDAARIVEQFGELTCQLARSPARCTNPFTPWQFGRAQGRTHPTPSSPGRPPSHQGLRWGRGLRAARGEGGRPRRGKCPDRLGLEPSEEPPMGLEA